MKKILFLLLFVPFLNITECLSQEENKRSYSVSCLGITKRGTICKNKTLCNNSRCYWHGGNCYNKSNSNNSFKSGSVIKLPITTIRGMKYIMIELGGKNYKYLIDTGASDMVINEEMKNYLMSIGILKQSDFRDNKIYEIANGEKIEFKTAILNTIKIDGKEFKNIKIAIGKNASLLLGMSFLNRYNWRFNDSTLEFIEK